MTMIIKSYSGDTYKIPDGQEHEYKEYLKAVAKKDEKEMMRFETGETGWIDLTY